MNKKGLSILLALSMVFSLNTFAFAEEATVTAVSEEVEIEQTQSSGDYDQSINAYEEQTSWAKEDGVSMNGTSLEAYSGTGGVAYYNGKKITADSLGLRIEDSKENYGVGVKSIKLTGSNKKATATGKVTFKINSIKSFKDVYGTGNRSYQITVGEAKAAYKNLKAAFKTAKDQEFTAYIAPTYIKQAISQDALKSLKKLKASLSDDDIEKYGITPTGNKSAVLITTKNGTVKKAQLVYADYNWKANSVYQIKIKTRKLKKDRDYVVSGDSIVFDKLDTYSGGTIKAT